MGLNGQSPCLKADFSRTVGSGQEDSRGHGETWRRTVQHTSPLTDPRYHLVVSTWLLDDCRLFKSTGYEEKATVSVRPLGVQKPETLMLKWKSNITRLAFSSSLLGTHRTLPLT